MAAGAFWRRARWLLALVGLCTLATCPAAQRSCSQRRHAREAPLMLGYLVDEIRGHVAAHGTLPDVTAGPTPPIGSCCADGATCAPDPSQWNTPGWRALRFSIDGRHALFTCEFNAPLNVHRFLLSGLRPAQFNGRSGFQSCGRLLPRVASVL